VDERGNVVGIVSAKLSAKAALDTSGTLPENVNYAVKSSFVLGFLESMPAVAAKLKEPNTNDEKFEDAVKSAEQSAVLVLVYSPGTEPPPAQLNAAAAHPAAPQQPAPDKFTVGRVYQDARGNKATYLGDGKWQQ
jgi:hypothetical protein